MKNGSFARAIRARWSAPGLLLVLLLGTLLPSGGARAQDCGDSLVADGTAGSCAADGGGAGGTSPLDPVAPDDAGSAGADPLAPPATVGNPISLFTGNKREVETDFSLPGAALAFRRFYNSANEAWRSGVGQGWSHTYAVTLFATPDGARELLQSDGRRLHFAPAGTDDKGRAIFRTASAFEGTLVATAENAHRWELPDGRHLLFNGSYLIEIDWPDQRHLSLYYQQQRLASVTDETGRVLRLAYWPGVSGADRALGGYEPQDFGPASGQLASLTLPDGEVIGYEYDRRSNLTRTAYPDGTQREYHYEDATYPSHLTGLTDRTGVRFASWTYDGQGRAISSEHAGGVERVMLAYPKASAIEAGQTVGTTVTNSLGQSSRYTWEQPVGGSPRLLEATGSGCASCPPTGMRWRYDAAGRLSEAVTTGEGTATGTGTVHYAHDEAGRLAAVQRTLPDGTRVPVERREYDGDSARVSVLAVPSVASGDTSESGAPTGSNASGNVSGSTDAEYVIETRFDTAGRPIEITERGFSPQIDLQDGEPAGYRPIERTRRFSYEAGRLVAIDGPRDDVDDVTRFGWDEANRLVATLPPDAPRIGFGAMDALGRPTSVRLGATSPYRIEYDPRGRVARLTQRDREIDYRHDAEGRLVSVTDTDGRTLRLEHDAAGRLERITDGIGRATTFAHDTESRLAGSTSLGIDGSVIRALAHTFDANGRPVRSSEERLDTTGRPRPTRTFEHEIDAPRTRARLIDVDTGASVRHALDRRQRLMGFTDIDGSATRIAFDVAGREIARRGARDNLVRYPSDDFGRIVFHEGPDTGRVRYEHDAAGNRTREVHADGGTVTGTWDAADRPLERRDANGITRWHWDGASGTLVSITDPVSIERFGHDAQARLVRHERELGGRRFVTKYVYDAHDRVIGKTLPGGERLRYRYHETGPDRGSLQAITRSRGFGLLQEAVVDEIDVDARDGDSGHVSAGGVRTERTFAPNGELTALSIGDALALDYTFDDAGRIRRIDTDGQPARYGYANGRLAWASEPDGQATLYRHDAAGNRLEDLRIDAEGRGRSATYRYAPDGEGNRLLERRVAFSNASNDEPGRRTAYRYDGRGAPLAVGELAYTYDAFQRAVSVRRDGELIATYAYNGFGQRVRKTVHGGAQEPPRTTWFLYDGDTLATEIDDRGEPIAHYVHLDGHRPVAKLADGAVYGIHTDHLGTPRMMTDGTGRTVWQASYTPFGKARVNVADVELPLRLPGQYADAETGTHYNYYRDYDPATGRYLTSDPIGLAGGANAYAYAEGDPLGSIDALGLRAGPVGAPGLVIVQPLIARPPIGTPGSPWVQRPPVSGPPNRQMRTDRYRIADAALRRFEPDRARIVSSPDWSPDWDEVFDVEYELYAAHHEYYLRYRDAEACDAGYDPALWEASMRAAAQYGNVYGPLAQTDPLPQETLDRIREVYGRDYERYRANGGTESFEQWLLDGRPEDGETTSVVVYPNQRPGKLEQELATAYEQGVRPVASGSTEFDRIISSGEPLIWAIDESGRPWFAPRSVNGISINHPILTNGMPVLSAGEAEIIKTGNGEYVLLDISNRSGHYMPSEESLDIAREIFEKSGIRPEF